MADREDELRVRYEALAPGMTEAELRRWAAAEARSVGWGGVTLVARVTGLSRPRITRGLADLADPDQTARVAAGHIRRPGAGRPPATDHAPGLVAALERLVAASTRGDPESPLQWSSKSTAKLAQELRALGFPVSAVTVGAVLVAQGYSLQAPRKTHEGGDHPDRDAQFQHIQAAVEHAQATGQPVISVDCKKKELVGEFKNGGREWQPKGHPVAVNVYDFPTDALFKAIPYGVYDLTRNEGWVGVGITHETAEFAVDTIRQWWRQMGRRAYPAATALVITADGGGSNSSRSRGWKLHLQDLADRTGLTIQVCHFPPGTSKWNKIEHRLFSQITLNWRGRPLTTLEAIVSLIAATHTKTGLKVAAMANQKTYRTGIKIPKARMKEINLTRDAFHGEWNYTIRPRSLVPSKL